MRAAIDVMLAILFLVYFVYIVWGIYTCTPVYRKREKERFVNETLAMLRKEATVYKCVNCQEEYWGFRGVAKNCPKCGSPLQRVSKEDGNE